MKILHIADVHLDSPFSSCSVTAAGERQNELRETFENMMKYAKDEKFSLVLIAGDLFDYGYVTKKTAELLCDTFAEMPECKIVISPGNHDAYTRNGVYASIKFPPNVYIFQTEKLTSFSFDDIGVDVYGYAFTSEKIETSPLSYDYAEKIKNPDRLNLLCIHADISSPISRYSPVTKKDLADFGADYAALGHIHNSEEIEKAGNCTYAYSGCPEGRSFDETGYKGAIVIGYDGIKDGKKALTAERKRFSKRSYQIETIDITGAASNAEVLEAIKGRIEKLGYGEETALRVELTGALPSEYIPDITGLEKKLDMLYSAEIKDCTLPIYDDKFLREDVTIKGEFYRSLLEKMTSGDAAEREIAVMALRYGLAALDGKNLSEL